MEHDGFLELVAAHALDSLDGPDRQSVEQHIRGCEDCRAQLEQHGRVTELLAASLPPHAASPLLRSRILDAAGAAQTPATPARAAAVTTARPRRRQRRMWPAFAGSCAVAAACVL